LGGEGGVGSGGGVAGGCEGALVLAEVLEGLGPAEGGDVAQAAGEPLLPALESGEGQLVEVAAGRVLRRREAVQVVVQVPGERGEHLDEVLVRGRGAGGVARVQRGREGAGGGGEGNGDDGDAHGPPPIAHSTP